MSCENKGDLSKMLQHISQGKAQRIMEVEDEVLRLEAQLGMKKELSAKACALTKDLNSYDWTQTYAKWDAWQDPDEIAQLEQAASEKKALASKSQYHAMCDHDHSAEQRLMDMNTNEKLSECDRFRLLGNRMYEQGQFERAASYYRQALVYFEYMFPETPEETEMHDRLRTTMLVNLATCYLKLMHYDEVIHNTTQVISQDPSHVKALYIRAKAYRFRDEFEKSIRDLRQAIDFVKDKESQESITHLLMRELHLTQTKQLAYKLRLKQMSKAMFSQNACFPAKQGDDIYGVERKKSESDESSKVSLATWQPIMYGMEELNELVQKLEGRGN